MEHARLVSPGSFCWSQDCPDYGKVDHANIVKFGRTKKGTQHYQCKTCGKTFVETRGTVFYGHHHSQETIPECLAWLAERNSLAAIHRVKGIQGRGGFGLVEGSRATGGSDRSPSISQFLSQACSIGCPVDVCGSQGGKGGHPEEDDRGTFWRGVIIDIETRLRVGRAIGKDEDEGAAALMAQLKARGHPDAPPAIATDGQGSYREAMVETWGRVPEYWARATAEAQTSPT